MRLIDADALLADMSCAVATIKQIEDAPTIELLYDYPIKKLVAFAKMCEDAGVTNEDLKTLCNNFMFAHDAFHRDMQRQINAMIEQFCTDKLDVEPSALRGEDDGNTD